MASAPRVKNQRKFSPLEDHKRQMIWQVWTPLGVSIAVMFAAAVLTVIGAFQQSPQVERWGNLSAVWVIMPVLLSGTIFIVISIACVYGLSWLLKRTPDWMLRLQLLIVQIGLIIRRAADATTKPVIAIHKFNARANALWRELAGKKQRTI